MQRAAEAGLITKQSYWPFINSGSQKTNSGGKSKLKF